MRGPPFQNVAVDFKLDLKNLRSPPGIPQVTRSNFKLQRTSFNQAAVSLIRSIQGPQEIELELFMKLFRGSSVGGVALAKIHVYVSEYDF